MGVVGASLVAAVADSSEAGGPPAGTVDPAPDSGGAGTDDGAADGGDDGAADGGDTDTVVTLIRW